MVDEFVHGLMHRALELVDDDGGSSELGLDKIDGSMLDGEEDHDKNASENDDEDFARDLTLLVSRKATGPKAFIGKRGLVFGYWSKTPYG